MAELKLVTKCCGAPIEEMPSDGKSKMRRCSSCKAEYIWNTLWACEGCGLEAKESMAKDKPSCPKCPSTVYIPSLRKPERRPRCRLCAELLDILTTNRRQRCVNADDVDRCGSARVVAALAEGAMRMAHMENCTGNCSPTKTSIRYAQKIPAEPRDEFRTVNREDLAAILTGQK